MHLWIRTVTKKIKIKLKKVQAQHTSFKKCHRIRSHTSVKDEIGESEARDVIKVKKDKLSGISCCIFLADFAGWLVFPPDLLKSVAWILAKTCTLCFKVVAWNWAAIKLHTSLKTLAILTVSLSPLALSMTRKWTLVNWESSVYFYFQTYISLQ